jgi:NAD(P)-dependent dehydrogenase (short-subunit alcohol dehydrogenase family)
MKTWFITGAAQGFGMRLTEQLIERGDRVAATSRNLATLEALRSKAGDRLWIAALDVTDPAQMRNVVAQAFLDLGHIDVVCSNAGYGLNGAAEELSDESIARQIDTNLIGSIQLVRAVIPYLRAQGGGRILQVSSMGGQMTFPGLSLYHTTKWGIEGFLESVIPEVAPFGIEITIVEPGSARTEFGGASGDFAPRTHLYDEQLAWMRRLPAGENRSARVAGDPKKMARAMIDSVEISPAPRRLTLGSDAFRLVLGALRARVAELEPMRDLAYSTDVNDS